MSTSNVQDTLDEVKEELAQYGATEEDIEEIEDAQEAVEREKRGGRFSIIPAKAVDDPRLNLGALRLLAILGTYGDRNGWCFPSLKTMAERVGGDKPVSKQYISRCIRELSDLGYVEIHHRFRKNGSQRSSLYRIIFGFGEGGKPKGSKTNGKVAIVNSPGDHVHPPSSPKRFTPPGDPLTSHSERPTKKVPPAEAFPQSQEEEGSPTPNQKEVLQNLQRVAKGEPSSQAAADKRKDPPARARDWKVDMGLALNDLAPRYPRHIADITTWVKRQAASKVSPPSILNALDKLVAAEEKEVPVAYLAKVLRGTIEEDEQVAGAYSYIEKTGQEFFSKLRRWRQECQQGGQYADD